MNQTQTLPSKEANLFTSTLTLYENKQYKQGLKATEQILKNFPEHGETLAMKGLFLGNMGKKQEAFDLVKKGIRLNLKSHICWHVYGLLYRADRNYEEAVKCYRNALKFDSENVQILRDLGVLQLQLRQLEAYCTTQNILVQIRPQFKTHWFGLIIGLDLLGKYSDAVKVLQAYETSQPETIKDLEWTELMLYKANLLESCGDLESCLDLFKKFENVIMDKYSVLEHKGRILLKLNKKSEAEVVYRKLLDRNPDYISFYRCLENCIDSKDNLYQEYQHKFPRSVLPNLIPLYQAVDFDFKEKFQNYFNSMIKKDIPSLFSSCKELYKDQEKIKIIEEIALTSFSNENFSSKSLFLALHFDFKLDHEKSLKYLNEAILKDSENVELLRTRAKILKHCGDLKSAIESLKLASQKDPGDRYLNTKTTKYLLRDNQLDLAQETVGFFIKGEKIEDKIKDLVEIQAFWFILECAKSYKEQGNLEKAKEFYTRILSIFEEIWEDQFDFIGYCLRKGSLRTFIKLIKSEDEIYERPELIQAVDQLIQIQDLESLTEKMENVSISKEKEDSLERFIKKMIPFMEKNEKISQIVFDFYSKKGNELLCLNALKTMKGDQLKLYLIKSLKLNFKIENSLFEGKSLEQLEESIKVYSLDSCISKAKAQVILRDKIDPLIFKNLQGSHKEMVQLHKFLKSLSLKEESDLSTRCKEKFPRSNYFSLI